MNISVENIDKVNAVMTAVVEPADYTEKYEKAIKDAKKKMNMPGFRPGMVPVGLIKKQFGVSILAEEVNKVLQDGLFGYIRENKINMLGEPLPTEDNNNVELKEGESFTFKFELAIAPEFEVSLTKKDKIDYYNVEVSDQMVENQVDMYRQRGVYAAGHFLFVVFWRLEGCHSFWHGLLRPLRLHRCQTHHADWWHAYVHFPRLGG